VTNQSWLNVARVVVAISAVVAMVYQLFNLSEGGSDHPAVDFFSFFTIQSNIFGVVILLISVQRSRQGVPSSPTFDLLRGAAVLYLATTGVVYGLLLNGYQEELQTVIPWVNTIVHRITPLYLVADWLIAPPRSRIEFPRAFKWLIYPAVYLIYSLIRGPIADWYPYPFLDPDRAGGYLGVTLYCIGIALAIAAFSWVIAALSKREPDSAFAAA
jgi:hypothetical protein